MRKVLIVADSMSGPSFWKAFTECGRRERKDQYDFLFFSRERLRFYRRFFSTDAFVDLSTYVAAYGENVGNLADLEDRSRRFEETHDSTIMDLLQADRHLGRGLYYLGHRHMDSLLTRRVDYWCSVKLIVDLAERLHNVFASNRVDVVVQTGVASLVTKLVCVVARARGIPVRVLSPGRAGNLYFWAEDEFLRTSALTWSPSDRVDTADTAASDPLGNYVAVHRIQETFRQNFSVSGISRRIGTTLFSEGRKILGTFVRGRKRDIESYLLSQRIHSILNVYLEHRQLQAVITARKGQIPGKFVFLPLHVEPEAALMVLSPEFNNQIAVIDQLAKALPSGIFLMIKENPIGIGRRPKGFYRWLASIPNARLAPLDWDGCDLARRSALTVTITGTAGLEAAVAGVPVITFGQHNLYNVLDHVHLGTDFSKLRDQVRALLAMTPEERTRAARQGRQLFEAIRAMCVDLGDLALNDEGAAPLLEAALARSLGVTSAPGVVRFP